MPICGKTSGCGAGRDASFGCFCPGGGRASSCLKAFKINWKSHLYADRMLANRILSILRSQMRRISTEQDRIYNRADSL
jgi:hypothetical protein